MSNLIALSSPIFFCFLKAIVKKHKFYLHLFRGSRDSCQVFIFLCMELSF